MDGYPLSIRARGNQVLSNPLLNQGTAFTDEERQALDLTGLLPNGVSSMEGQLRRVYAQYRRQPTDLAKNVDLVTYPSHQESDRRPRPRMRSRMRNARGPYHRADPASSTSLLTVAR